MIQLPAYYLAQYMATNQNFRKPIEWSKQGSFLCCHFCVGRYLNELELGTVFEIRCHNHRPTIPMYIIKKGYWRSENHSIGSDKVIKLSNPDRKAFIAYLKDFKKGPFYGIKCSGQIR